MREASEAYENPSVAQTVMRELPILGFPLEMSGTDDALLKYFR
jgi:hypothetical protein